MNLPILNRAFQHPGDGWYQIEAAGEHPNRRAGVIQVLDAAACQSIVNRFNAEAAQPGFAGMLIDHEHFKHDQDKETVAYGWLGQLQNRADGIYGQIRWTDTGKKAVDGGDYRFFSTEYDQADLEDVAAPRQSAANDGSGPRAATNPVRHVRPLKLDGLTLTNVNNNKGQKPITNRAPEDFGAQKAKQKMKTVCTLLGLSTDASEEAVHAEVARTLNRVKELEGGQIEADLETYKNRFDPKQREFIKSLLVTNRAATLEFLQTQPEGKGQLAPARLHNRHTAQPVDAAAGGTADEAALSAERNSAIDQYKFTNRCSFQQAHDAVRRKKPELFGITRQ
jgi:phage I-like protein